MSIVVVSTVIDAPVEQVWHRMGDFAGWHTWLPRIVDTTMDPGQDGAPVGAVRTLLLADGDSVRERLVAKDEHAHTFAYEFDGPHRVPVSRYVGRVRMEAVTTTGQTYVHWSGDFDSAAADEDKAGSIFTRIYSSFLAALASDVADLSKV